VGLPVAGRGGSAGYGGDSYGGGYGGYGDGYGAGGYDGGYGGGGYGGGGYGGLYQALLTVTPNEVCKCINSCLISGECS